MKLCPQCGEPIVCAGWLCSACGWHPEFIERIPILAPDLACGGAGFDPDAFAELAEVEAGSFWFRARNRLIIWAMKRHFPHMQRYLEIGCGTGYVLSGVAEAYPSASLVGSEVFAVGLPFAERRVGRAKLLQMDARRIPHKEEFDVIGAFDVLEHIEEDEVVLGEMWRALGSGGGIAVIVPQHPWLWSAQDDYACHVRRYSIGELREKVEHAGFRVELETSFVSLLLPAMAASRLAKPTTIGIADMAAELKLPFMINALFAGIMYLERLVIRVGIRFPIGGSLLLLARKKDRNIKAGPT